MKTPDKAGKPWSAEAAAQTAAVVVSLCEAKLAVAWQREPGVALKSSSHHLFMRLHADVEPTEERRETPGAAGSGSQGTSRHGEQLHEGIGNRESGISPPLPPLFDSHVRGGLLVVVKRRS